jgi:hypothetical protein
MAFVNGNEYWPGREPKKLTAEEEVQQVLEWSSRRPRMICFWLEGRPPKRAEKMARILNAMGGNYTFSKKGLKFHHERKIK